MLLCTRTRVQDFNPYLQGGRGNFTNGAEGLLVLCMWARAVILSGACGRMGHTAVCALCQGWKMVGRDPHQAGWTCRLWFEVFLQTQAPQPDLPQVRDKNRGHWPQLDSSFPPSWGHSPVFPPFPAARGHRDEALTGNSPPTHRFHYAARIWDGVKKSSALAEYSRLLA